MSLTDLVPPHDAEAERCVLGAMLCDPDCIDQAATLVSPGDFYLERHRTVFAAVVAMHLAGTAIDAVTLGYTLQAREELEDIGGAGAIAELYAAVPHAAHLAHYAARVKDQSLRRLAIMHGTAVVRAASNPSADADQVLAIVEQKITELVESRTSGGHVRDLQTCLLACLDRIEAGHAHGLHTGWVDLDNLTTGMHPGQLIVLAARPSVGKTGMALNLAHQIAHETPVLFFSLEMSHLEIAERIGSLESCVPLHVVRSGQMTADQHQQFIAGCNTLHDREVYVCDKASQTLLDITSVARQYKRAKGVGLIVVDYLGLVSPADERTPREQQVAQTTRGLKCLAKSLQVPVLLLAQLNREIEKRKDKLPLLSDLRESGAIEQDADQVWMLHRAAVGMDESDPNYEEAKGRAEVYVRKNRSGRTGMAPLSFQGDCVRFRNFSGQSPTFGMPLYPDEW